MDRSTRLALCAIGAAALAATAAAGAQTLVNIKGYGSDGAGVAGPEPYPLPPGTTLQLFNTVDVALKAGDYLIADAWGQPGALYDAWNYNASEPDTWDSHFYVALRQGNGTSYTLLLDAIENRNPACPNPNCSWPTEAQAAAAFLATPAFHLHLAQDEVVSFASSDYFLADNLGGISLRVTAVPEPRPALLFAAGLAAVSGWARRRLRAPSVVDSAAGRSSSG